MHYLKRLQVLQPKNRYGIAANNPAKSQQNTTAHKPSDFFISLIESMREASFTIFFSPNDIINAEIPAIAKGGIELYSPKTRAAIMGTKRTILKYVIAKDRLSAHG